MALEKVGKKVSDKTVKIMIHKVDDNGDGVVQFNEFQTLLRVRRSPRPRVAPPPSRGATPSTRDPPPPSPLVRCASQDWDKIIEEAEAEEARLAAANAAAAPQKFTLSNAATAEEMARRRSLEIEMGVVDLSTPARGLSKKASKESFYEGFAKGFGNEGGSGPGSRTRSRRASKELNGVPIIPEAGSPEAAGSALSAARALGSTPGDAGEKRIARQSKELPDVVPENPAVAPAAA